MSIDYPSVSDAVRDQEIGSRLDLSPEGQAGSVVKELVSRGTGEEYPMAGDSVSISYTSYLGTEPAPEYIFDSSEKNGKLFTYTVGKGRVIQGFEIGAATMRKGERARIYMTPEFGFGQAGAPPKVPANTPIIFDATIEKHIGEDLSLEEDGSVLKHMLQKGSGWPKVYEPCMVKLGIKGWHGDRLFDERTVDFPFGEGIAKEYRVPDHIQHVLNQMRENELARLEFKSSAAYGDQGCPELGIPPGADLKYHVHLLEFEKKKDAWEMNNKEKLRQSQGYKNKGTFYFKKQEFELARRFYQRSVDYVEHDYSLEGEEDNERRFIVISGYLNLALVCLKMEQYGDARKHCDIVLKWDPKNVKAFYRRAQANFNLREYQKANDDFVKVLELEPDNKAAHTQLAVCKERLKQDVGVEKQLYKNMMSDIGKGANGAVGGYESGMQDIGDWDNSMASGMMTLEQECEAFDEPVPRTGDNNHGLPRV